jgi:hypothetical protein
MDKFPFYLFAAAVLHVTEEYFFPGGFIKWITKFVPSSISFRLTVKFAVIVNGLFLLLCLSAVFIGGRYPMFALSIAGLVLVNGFIHLISSVVTRSYSPGLITSLLFYIPIPVYLFNYFELGSAEIIKLILYGILYHLAVPLALFSPFNKPQNTITD